MYLNESVCLVRVSKSQDSNSNIWRKEFNLERNLFGSFRGCSCISEITSHDFLPQRRLGDAAKKAIGKLQVRTIRKGDKETEADFDNCAVCIEGYKANDVVRVLPCR